ncbi:MAG: hypothetical protein IKN59_02505 [Paludibacteraceae bacterium]|nr:hypothetical protein [Paludibacteraceae bacterium]
MKKILSFLLLGLLCSIGNLWAADYTAPATTTYGDLTFLDVDGTDANVTVGDEEYLTYGALYIANVLKVTTWYNVSDNKPAGNKEYGVVGDFSSQGFIKVTSTSQGNNNGEGGLKHNSNRIRYYYVTGASSIAILANDNGSSKYTQLSIQEVDVNGTLGEAIIVDGNKTSSQYVLDGGALDPSKYYKISVTSNNTSNCVVYQLRFGKGTACTDPNASFTVDSKASTTMYTTGSATLALSSDNTSAVSYSVTKDADAITEGYSISNAGVFTVTAGAGVYVITATQAADGTHCAVEESVTVTVNAMTPVTSATIDGPTKGYVGYELTYTATAANATTFTWYVDGVVQGSDSSKFIYAAVKGNHAIYCVASNVFNDGENPAPQSNTINISVTSLYGELIKATLKGGTSATMTGIIGGTFDTNLGSGKYKLDKGKYIGIRLANGTFQAGDTAIISMSAESQGNPCLFGDKERDTVLFLATEATSETTYKIVLPDSVNDLDLTTLYLSRESSDDGAIYKWNPTVSAISVVRPMPEKSRVAVLSGATIDGVALAEADLNTLKSSHSFASTSQFANAPVVKFYTSVTVTYEDDSQKVINDSIVVTAVENGDLWQAQAEIDAVTYTITAVHPVSFTVSYKYGETLLGEETVIAGENPAKYEDAQKAVQLMACNGWFSDALLSNAVTIESAIITQDTTFYGSFSPLFATSINIEQLVLDNGKSYDLMAQMGAQHYSSNITIDSNTQLDSLGVKDDGKRNYSYLGLKVKKSGALLNFRVENGNTVKVKFGNIATTPQVSINGGAYADMEITNKVYTYEASADALISIKMMDGNAVVFKQIQIGANPEFDVVSLPVKLGTNGWLSFAADYKYTVSGATVYKAAYNGTDAVVLTEVENAVVPANAGIILKGNEGELAYITESTATATNMDGNNLVGVVQRDKSFNVENVYVIATQIDNEESEATTKFYPASVTDFPANKAYMVIAPAQQGAPVRIVFAENNTTDINSLEASEKAQKFFENGNLYILREGVVYDATGRVVR